MSDEPQRGVLYWMGVAVVLILFALLAIYAAITGMKLDPFL